MDISKANCAGFLVLILMIVIVPPLIIHARALSELLVQDRLSELEEEEKRILKFSRITLFFGCVIGELALILSTAAAVWSHRYEVCTGIISDLKIKICIILQQMGMGTFT